MLDKFKDGWLFFITTNSPLPKTSQHARLQWWLVLLHCYHPATIEIEQARSISMVVHCSLSPPSQHCRNQACVLVVDGSFLLQ
jgi:hypothetical protein